MRSVRRLGLSIIELLVVIAVLAVIFGIGFVVLPRDRFAVNQAVERFERDIQRAKFNAISHNTALEFTVDPANGRYVAVPLSTDPGAQRAGFEVVLARDGPAGVGIAEINAPGYGTCDGDAGPGTWRFDARGVGRQEGVRLVVFEHVSSGFAVPLCVNSYGRVERQ
jgi:prepilin-type N-terminal cleavage/methylation domain-containing protein